LLNNSLGSFRAPQTNQEIEYNAQIGEELESLVAKAGEKIHKRLIEVLFEEYKFYEHCWAIKRYLLLGQGDFIEYLMDLLE
jgi:hypothetical protein